MREDCVRAVTEAAAAAGRTLTQKDLQGIESRMKQALRDNARDDIEGFRKLTRQEQLTQAADRIATEIGFEKQRAFANVARQIIAHDRNQSYVDRMVAGGMRRLEAVGRLLHFTQDNRSGVAGLEQTAEGIVRTAKGNMEGFPQATSKFAGYWTDKAMVRDVWKELYGEDSGNATAKELARRWSEDIAEPLRKQFNEYGGNVKKRSDWAAPQDHSMMKVAKAGPAKWIADVMNLLDRSEYVNDKGELLSDNELRAVLGDVHLSIATDGAWDREPQPGSALRNRGDQRRVLHFKDATSYLAYQAQYGEKSLLETMNSHIESAGHNIAALQVFGPQAEAGFKALLDDAHRRDTSAYADANQAKKAREKLEMEFALASGKLRQMGDPSVARKFQIARSILSAARLGSASLSAITDSSNMMMVAKAWNLPMLSEWARWESKAWTSAEFRQFMRSQGIGVEAITHAISRYSEEVFGHGFSNALANTVFRVSGLNFIDNVRRTATGAMLFHRIGELARQYESLDKADPADVARLRDAGVTDKHWEVWRQAAMEAGDDGMLSPVAINRLANRSDAVRRDAMQMLVGTVSRDVDTVVPMPTLKARASAEYLLSGLRGKPGGELLRSMMQFKSFPIAMISNHWQRLQSQPTGLGKAVYAAELIATSTILGALSVQLKSLVAGNNPQDMTDPKFVARAFIQGGASGLYGDIIAGSVGLFGTQRHLTDQMGPLASTLSDTMSMIGTAWKSGTDPESHANVGGEATRLIKGNTPFANVWWAKAALDHLIFQRLQDYYSPGYGQRMQERLQKQYNAGAYWPPSTAGNVPAPNAPNLKTAVGGR